tara:strand:- start:1139 stop:1417 length:279 start_codon:yes stop_codon:yes gene_type:complete
MKLNQGSEFTLDLKTIGIIVGMVISVSGTYFTLKADIDANKKALENGNWVSATEYDLKDELVRTTIMSNSKKLDAIENKLNTIDNRLYNLNK